MGLLRVLLVRAAEADVRPDSDQRGPVIGQRGLDRAVDRLQVIAVLDPRGAPAVGLEALQHVLRPGHLGGAVELDPVVVIQHDEPSEAEMAGEARALRRDALLQIPVRRDDERPVVDDLVPWAIELPCEPALGDRHANGVRQALPERPGRRLDAGREPVLGVTGGLRAPLPEALELLEREVVPREVEQRVQEHRGMAGGEHEPVAVRPVGILGGVAEVAGPEDERHRGGAHRRSGVPGVRLLHAIDGQRPDRGDRELLEGGGHRGES